MLHLSVQLVTYYHGSEAGGLFQDLITPCVRRDYRPTIPREFVLSNNNVGLTTTFVVVVVVVVSYQPLLIY